ncbi:MAG: hypothetical protein B7Y02_15155 [Rhodobacterales bacterium 17-64-5]|nr:MAG: hypothetical protein B7Z31_12040 [Rhodobacterales bacterium 12-65-15]OZA05979.1 MAG: hypothetical protein B7Y02_15155 [Rhodobacterales bacterium 17-64-5]
MILAAFFRAMGQLDDPRFRRVLGLGMLLAIALLFGVYALFLQALQWLTPDQFDLPLIGPVTGVETLLGWASLFLMLGLSIFLMVPVATAFSGLFLEDVAAAVEARHYPHLLQARPMPMGEALFQTINFLGVLIAANLVALILYFFAGPFAPLVFWSVNGFLLGREYFTLVALRHLPAAEAKALRGRNAGTIWLAGTLMAAPLSVPILNLAIPVLGVATFTHLYHRLTADGR